MERTDARRLDPADSLLMMVAAVVATPVVGVQVRRGLRRRTPQHLTGGVLRQAPARFSRSAKQ
ncbi:MAG: hypothetical protein ABIT20_00825 [Gemmatimonadaceae bacterium]